MIRFGLRTLGLLAGALAVLSSAALAMPTEFTYQGLLRISGAPATGNFDLRFTLYDLPAGGMVKGAAFYVDDRDVSGGQLAVLLNFGAVFDGTERHLEIAVRAGSVSNADRSPATYSVLSPRQQITATPYALHAMESDELVLPYSATVDAPGPAFAITNSGGNGTAIVGTHQTTGNRGTLGAGGAGVIGAGTGGATGMLGAGNTGVMGSSSSGDGVYGVGGVGTEIAGIHGVAGTGGSAVYGVADFGSTAKAVRGKSAGGYAGFFEGLGYFSKSLGIGTAAPAARLHVTNPSTAASGDETVRLGAPGKGPNASHVHWGPRGDWYIRSASGTGNVLLQDMGGRVGIGTNAPAALLELRNTSASFSRPVAIATNFGTGTVADFSQMNRAGGEGVSIYSRSDTAAALHVNGMASVESVQVDGGIKTDFIKITGGADFSEGFDIGGGSDAPRPGMVVAIDPARPGRLAVATSPYDKKVAGIISGAGGVNPGMVMGQPGSAAHGKYPVALSGRVYCLADAGAGAIEPGDMLTTSATPGHAMKVTDPARAQGAVLGKAMSGLKRGEKGLILVLVTLQ